ncbi:MAG: toxin-antitoxin system, antitoxin component [Aeromicrobium sp.]|uniref:FitA-like ribbon-helix-helix domain-containing protein n=1 Tax=Aeromicrobium sp. TaxID=1871063 RepID=UPI0039E50CC3
MTTMIQVRNVPDDLHRELKVRAAREGVTLSELALNELRRAVSFPSVRDLSERLASRPVRSYGGETAAESTRAERDSR